MSKKRLFIFFLIVFLCLVWDISFVHALEVQYPKIYDSQALTDTSTFGEYLKYVFNIGMFLGFFSVFLSLIWAGILYLLSPAIPNALSSAKDRVSGAISGLLILVLLYLIITTINPSLAIFNFKKLPEIPAPPVNNQVYGVNFYNSQDCSGAANTNTQSQPDLGNLKNKVNSVGISQNYKDNIYYVSILYDTINYWGKCQYINPNNPCVPVDPFAASASVYQYDTNPAGDGVYFYRKSRFNEQGGWVKISNGQIGKVYSGYLKDLKFTGEVLNSNNIKDCKVPKDEQDCATYGTNGKCLQNSCPTLAGENISSIKINGNYIVLLIYYGPSDDQNGPWTYCQLFPGNDDVNKNGPKQIKWDAIRSRGQNPNVVIIIPVAAK